MAKGSELDDLDHHLTGNTKRFLEKSRPKAHLRFNNTFDTFENAQKYVTEFFPNGAKKQNTGHTTRLFGALIVEEASRDMGSVHFGGKISSKPDAFVYTELQVYMPFSNVPWRQRNPIKKKLRYVVEKTSQR